MSTFTLAISCLTTSNLPWFMDLTFQVPMQYCSLQHQTLLLSPVTSTTGYCFCFGSIPSFFLELFLGISELKWTGLNEFNSDDHYIYYCGQESLRRNGLLLGRKVMTNLDSILESRDITLSSKGPSSQGYCFSSGHVRM